MNRIHLHFPSDALHTYVDVTVCLPKKMKTPLEDQTFGIRETFKTVYMLHGALDCGDSWLTHTDLEDLVEQSRIAVVLPSCGNSFYLDEPDGLAWFTYVTEELPAYLQSILPLSDRREDRFIGGLSMGGYGALYAALKKPDRYGKVFALSGAVDIRRTAFFVSSCGASLPSHMRRRKELPGSEYDLFRLTGEAVPAELPELFLACGKQDFLFGDNRNLTAAFDKAGIAYEWMENDGDHEWKFWQAHLAPAFAFLSK